MADTNADLAAWLTPTCARAGVACTNWQAAITAAIEPLIALGAVDQTYAQAVLAREQRFPTGLPTHPYGVALPHADGTIYRAALSLITLRTAIAFGHMSAPDETVDVRIVIGLAVPPQQQIATLEALFVLLQQPAFLEAAIAAPDDATLYQCWQQWTCTFVRKDGGYGEALSHLDPLRHRHRDVNRGQNAH